MPEKKEAETEVPNESMKQDIPKIKEEKRDIEPEEVLINDISNSIYHINSEHLQNAVYNPQKLLSLFDDLMKNFRLYIPKFISSGPALISSRFSSEYNVISFITLACKK